jgi:hypothetical protein
LYQILATFSGAGWRFDFRVQAIDRLSKAMAAVLEAAVISESIASEGSEFKVKS